MAKLEGLSPKRVFEIFEEICAIPHGSENMEKISQYCIDFANKCSLRAFRDEYCNVVIFKDASVGYENCEPVILQGHLDMVCQSVSDKAIDFENEPIEIYTDGDFVKANGTTLGADNGIALAMILAILESESVKHPPIEAVFTIDEEIGMIGAGKLNTDILKGKRLINIDSEEDDTVTVSCAGGSDLVKTLKMETVKSEGRLITLTLSGLLGGHSGVEINSGRVNANILAGRILNHLYKAHKFDILSISGGDKGNAIPNLCEIKLVTQDAELFVSDTEEYLNTVKEEICERESSFKWEIEVLENENFSVFSKKLCEDIIYLLNSTPNGVMEMSHGIEGLVETSLNLGILETKKDCILLHFTLRSNKMSALSALEERMVTFLNVIKGETETFGHYPAWEYNRNSQLQRVYTEAYTEQNGTAPKVAAIHAGLECGLFSNKIKGLDCISMGPDMRDVHTVNERLSISSTEKTYNLLLSILERLK